MVTRRSPFLFQAADLQGARLTPHGHKDEAAIAEAYRRYGHALYRRALTLLAQSDDAHEVVQEAFCQFWSARERFRGQSTLFTYLYRITTNLSIDRLRRRTTAGTTVPLEDARLVSVAGGSERVVAAQELAVLMEGLDEDTMMIGVLAHLDRMTQDEIAAAFDLSRRTIGKRLKRFDEHVRRRAGVA